MRQHLHMLGSEGHFLHRISASGIQDLGLGPSAQDEPGLDPASARVTHGLRLEAPSLTCRIAGVLHAKRRPSRRAGAEFPRHM